MLAFCSEKKEGREWQEGASAMRSKGKYNAPWCNFDLRAFRGPFSFSAKCICSSSSRWTLYLGLRSVYHRRFVSVSDSRYCAWPSGRQTPLLAEAVSFLVVIEDPQ